MRRIGIVVVAAAVALSASGCWLQLGGDALHTDFNPNETTLTATNVHQLHQVWKTNVGSASGAPVTYGNHLVVTHGSTITALAKDTGVENWHDTISDPGELNAFGFSGVGFIGGKVLGPYGNGFAGGTFTYDIDTGARTFGPSNGPGGAASAPVDNGAVTAITGSYIRSGANPFEVYVHYGAHNGLVSAGGISITGPATPPMIMGDHVYVGFESKFAAFPISSCTPSPDDATMCAPDWSVDLGSNMTTPVGTGTNIVVALTNGNVAVLDTSGNIVWQGLTGSTSATPPAFANNKLYVGAADGHVHEFDANGCGAATCAVIASVDAQAAVTTQPVVANGVLYAGTSAGKVEAFPAGACSAATCTPTVSVTVDAGQGVYSIIVDNGVVYATGGGGSVAAYSLP